jgi:hypothetical protein
MEDLTYTIRMSDVYDQDKLEQILPEMRSKFEPTGEFRVPLEGELFISSRWYSLHHYESLPGDSIPQLIMRPLAKRVTVTFTEHRRVKKGEPVWAGEYYAFPGTGAMENIYCANAPFTAGRDFIIFTKETKEQ